MFNYWTAQSAGDKVAQEPLTPAKALVAQVVYDNWLKFPEMFRSYFSFAFKQFEYHVISVSYYSHFNFMAP